MHSASPAAIAAEAVRHERGADVARLRDVAKERQLLDAQAGGHLRLRRRVDLPAHQPVDVLRRQPCVVQRRLDRLQRQGQLTPPRVARVVGLAHAGDRDLAPKSFIHSASQSVNT